MAEFYYFGTNPKPHKDMLAEYFSPPPRAVSCDIETISLKDRVPIGLSIATSPNDSFYFPMLPSVSPVLPWHILKDPSITKVFHNAPFDISCLDTMKYGIDKTNIGDTAAIARLLGYPPALVNFSAYVGMETRNAGEFMEELGAKTMLDVPEDMVAKKCMEDSSATIALYTKFISRMSATDLDNYSVDMAIIPVLLEMSSKGMLIDHEVRSRLEKKLDASVEHYRSLAEGIGFNPASPYQVGFILAKRGNFLPFTRSKRQIKTDVEVLKKCQDPVASLTLLFRKDNYFLTHYVKPWKDSTRAYTHFHLDAVTSRVSSTDRNMNNVPKGEARNMFLPDSGTWTDWDYSQLQLRILAYMSQDKRMLYVFESGGNIHEDTAKLLNTEYILAKSTNFCLPLRCQILTQYGWKSYWEIHEGDKTLGYNAHTQRNEWTKIEDVYIGRGLDMMNFNTSFIDFSCSNSHRWLGIMRHRHAAGEPDTHTTEIRRFKEFNSEFRLLLAAPADGLSKSSITEVEAAQIAWLLTDGHIERKNGSMVSATVFQKKEPQLTMMRELFAGISTSEYMNNGGTTCIGLHIKEVRKLWERAQLELISLEEFVLELTNDARESFLLTALLTEGHKLRYFYQNDNEVLKAVQLASYMQGFFPRVNRRVVRGFPSISMTLAKPIIGLTKMGINSVSTEDGWCVRTGLRTWTARDGDRIFLTGNAMVFGGTDETLAETAEVPIERARMLRQQWFSIYKEAADWIISQQNESLRTLKTYSMYNRMMLLPPEEKDSELRRKAINYPIQGSEAEIAKRAMLKCTHLDLRLLLYDEFLVDGDVEVPDGMDTVCPMLHTPYSVKKLERWE